MNNSILYPILKNFRDLLSIVSLSIVHHFKWKALQKSKFIKLELGSGPKKGARGWTTVDTKGADLYRDLRFGIPLKDEVVDCIYSSHLLEHIPYSSLLLFLADCNRVLKKGGFFSVCVPNARYYIKAYLEKSDFEGLHGVNIYGPAAIKTGSCLDQVNYIAYMDGQHCYMFDEENLINTLKLVGFLDVKLREFDPSVDMIERDYASIYAIARK
jgi:predicted SAM-dependent methyltransferase